MVAFSFRELLADGPASYLTGISDLEIRWFNGAPVLYAASGPSGGITSYALAPGGVTVLDRDAFQPGTIQAAPGQLEEITLGGNRVLVTLGHQGNTLQYFDLAADGQLVGTGQMTVQGGFPAAVVSMETVTLGARSFAYVGHSGIDGITVYEPDATGQLVRTGYVGVAGSAVQGADLVAMDSFEIGGQTYLLTLSAMNDTITSYRLDSNGVPVLADTLGADNGLSIAAPTGLVPVLVDGVQYVVVAAAGSSSLSVLRLDPGGQLVPVDHVIDSLQTRFQAVSAVEAIEIGGRTFLVAGGGDDGLSLFTVLPGGRLMHLAQIADSAGMALTNVTALALYERNGVIEVFASGEGEAGITRLSIDPGTIGDILHAVDTGQTLAGTAAADVLVGGAGNDNLRGQAGDDILIDGAGSDRLRGGAGADVFVFVADGVRDTVEDFEFGTDRLDLSGLGRLYSLSQVTITATAYGALIWFGDEEIRLHSADGLPLDTGAFRITDLVDLTHLPVDPYYNSGMVIGTAGADRLDGSDNADRLDGLAGNDMLNGLGGNDSLLGGSGNDVLNGDAGNDTLHGGTQEDRLYGGAGNDTLLGGAGFDRLEGGSGNDRLDGGNQADNLLGGTGNDTMLGGQGFDRLFGGDGDDRGYGGTETDALFGQQGNDRLYGQSGNDRMFGGTGNDLIDGGTGNDRLYGGAGFDTLLGSTGNDTMTGNFNADTFVFADFGGGFGQDVITDFAATNNFERIDLSRVSSIVNFADLAASHMSQVGANVVIDALGGNTITLLGVNLGDLDANDFIF